MQEGVNKSGEQEKLPEWLLTARQCERLRFKVQPGTKLTCRVMVQKLDATGRDSWYKPVIKTCRVKKIYPHVCLTDKGCFAWTELAYLNRDLVK